MEHFAKLLSPFEVKGKVFQSRCVVTAHSSASLSEPGTINDRLREYVSNFSKRKIGAFFLGETVVSDGTENGAVAWGIGHSKPGIEEQYAMLVEQACGNGMLVFEQLSHFGGQTWAVPGAHALAPSPIPQEISGHRPSAMSRYEIRNTVSAYSEAASRVGRGGLDGLEVKCDQGKLLHQFLSPQFNHRSDNYGGSLENRLRIIHEVAETCRAALDRTSSKRCLLSIRLSLTHIFDDAGYPRMNSPELIEVIQRISDWGVIDLFSFNLHTNSTYLGYTSAHPVNRTIHSHVPGLLKQAQEASQIPVLFTGGINHPSRAEWFLENTGIDLVGMTRACIADADVISKAASFRVDEIRPCIACNQGCVGNTWEGRPLSCTVNPDVGHARKAPPIARDLGAERVNPKSIAIVGAGPAGLEAALEATKFHCNVTLFDIGDRVGGKLLCAGVLPQKENYMKLVEFYEDQILRSSQVELHLKSSPSKDDLAVFSCVLDARGSKKASDRNPFRRRQVLDAVAASTQPQAFWVDRQVLLIDEDWLQDPLAIALKILRSGGVVTHIISTREYVGLGLDVVNLTQRLREIRAHPKGSSTSMLSFTKLEGIDGDGRVLLKDLCTSKDFSIRKIDTIVSVQSEARRVSDALLSSELPKVNIKRIGDAAGPRGVEYALRDARKTIWNILAEERNENQ